VTTDVAREIAAYCNGRHVSPIHSSTPVVVRHHHYVITHMRVLQTYTLTYTVAVCGRTAAYSILIFIRCRPNCWRLCS